MHPWHPLEGQSGICFGEAFPTARCLPTGISSRPAKKALRTSAETLQPTTLVISSHLESVGDPHLLSVDDKVAPAPPGAGGDGGDVAPGARLAHGDARHHVARQRGAEILSTKLVAPKPT